MHRRIRNLIQLGPDPRTIDPPWRGPGLDYDVLEPHLDGTGDPVVAEIAAQDPFAQRQLDDLRRVADEMVWVQGRALEPTPKATPRFGLRAWALAGMAAATLVLAGLLASRYRSPSPAPGAPELPVAQDRVPAPPTNLPEAPPQPDAPLRKAPQVATGQPKAPSKDRSPALPSLPELVQQLPAFAFVAAGGGTQAKGTLWAEGPVATAIATPQPTFRWGNLRRGQVGRIVIAVLEGNDVAVSDWSPEGTWTAPALERGSTYRWRLETGEESAEEVFTSQGRLDRRFQVAPLEVTQRLAGDLFGLTSPVERAWLFASAGMLDDATQELEGAQGPEADALRKEIARVRQP